MFDHLNLASETGLAVTVGPLSDASALAALRRQAFPNAKSSTDCFDAFATHVCVAQHGKPELLGAMRLLDMRQAQQGCGFYCQTEYECDAFFALKGGHLEISRVAVSPACADPRILFLLFKAARDIARKADVRFLFGLASYMSGPTAEALSDVAMIDRQHRISRAWRPKSRVPVPLPLVDFQADHHANPHARPPLVKAFLRAGAKSAQGGFYDRDFRTLDIMMIKDRHGGR